MHVHNAGKKIRIGKLYANATFLLSSDFKRAAVRVRIASIGTMAASRTKLSEQTKSIKTCALKSKTATIGTTVASAQLTTIRIRTLFFIAS